MSKFICAADLHVRQDRPRCRIDDNWEETQRLMINEIVTIANNKNCNLVLVGDTYDSPNCPARIIAMMIEELSKINNKVLFLAGNHELPYHSIENVSNSSIGIFMTMAKEHNKIVEGMSEYGQWNHFNCEVQGKKTGLLFQHRLVFENIKSMPPNVQAISAQELLKEYPDVDWIFLGDNHSAFHYEKNGKHIVNPGTTIRQSVNEQSYKPSVYYVNTENEIVERIYLNDNIAMVEDGYLVEETERINHIEAFVEKLKKNEAVELDFLSNIENGLLVNKKLSKETVKMIRELCAIKGEE